MSDVRVTGGYEPNDPVVMSREEYHVALERARTEAREEGMSEQDKQAKEVWEAAHGAWRNWPKDGKNHFTEAATACIAAALAQARREGREEVMKPGEHYWGDDRHKAEMEQVEAEGYQRGVNEKIQADEEMIIELANQVGQYDVRNQLLLEALSEIRKGEGRYNRDPLIHANNCIEDMKKIAVSALAPQALAPQGKEDR